ncbi:MAG TPA: transcriptional repressor [Bacteroidales bacterium]|jgi:Fur family peroxide stress response transcriptional regulator|nr:transcriptional repressor [Bacteroidales bacterium]OQB61781.1 MAG: Peroxide-responsive repressor PerR [Bacteroidetes bacterium ADurb.Bin145]NMD01639.1 transcriptional repressor [Bacteroidales bacterium]HOU01832.1 transcriptional repressor [Bacteroidales bacterium]HQG62564.1 transcriptional repressor [Bacteroidales bacterium]
MANNTVIRILAENNLKITPQRTAVLEVVLSLDTHPTVEEIAQYLRLNYPHVPIGTVYKILEKFVELGIIEKVKTDDGLMRYDAVTENHHHLYSPDSKRIEDYYDDELHNILDNYLKKKKIPNFEVKDFRLQIIGTFKEKK